MDAAPHLLIVDDDPEIRDLTARFLEKHGYRVDGAADGRAMFDKLETGRFDLLVLDLMLPGEDGLSLCRRLRARSNLPVIMLTCLGEETDRIVGLEMGADDYLAKPFNPRELLARIKAVLRRTALRPAEAIAGQALVFEGWRLDRVKRELRSVDGVLMPLTAGEFELLAAFVEHPRRVLSREQLLDLTKGRALANLLDNAVKYGREAAVSLIEGGDTVEIAIADRGPGIPEPLRERVFAPFFRLEPSRSRETGGVGLGLAVARGIVRRHGGDIVLGDRPGGGLLVRVCLPRLAARGRGRGAAGRAEHTG